MGHGRIVFLVGKYAVKFPIFITTRPARPVFGMMENIIERYWLTANCHQRTMTGNYPLAKIYFADPGGFILVAERCRPVTDDEWESAELTEVMKFGRFVDNSRTNFGVTADGRIVWVDYGYVTRSMYVGDFAWTVDCETQKSYIARKLNNFEDYVWELLEKFGIAVKDI